jgi:hypothetical protein
VSQQRIVISTEAAHAFVSTAVEKSASLPPPCPGQDHVLAFVLGPCLFFCCHPAGICCCCGLLPQRQAGKSNYFSSLEGSFPLCQRPAQKPEAHAIEFKFLKFGPKNACQAQKPSKPFKQNTIALAF